MPPRDTAVCRGDEQHRIKQTKLAFGEKHLKPMMKTFNKMRTCPDRLTQARLQIEAVKEVMMDNIGR
jgi:hypothetical protein